jgi:hypothetical protein
LNSEIASYRFPEDYNVFWSELLTVFLENPVYEINYSGFRPTIFIKDSGLGFAQENHEIPRSSSPGYLPRAARSSSLFGSAKFSFSRSFLGFSLTSGVVFRGFFEVFRNMFGGVLRFSRENRLFWGEFFPRS